MREAVRTRIASKHWREYTSADFGVRISLEDASGFAPHTIVLKEAGDLIVEDFDGVAAPLTNLPAWYPHSGQCRAILPGQVAALIVYW